MSATARAKFMQTLLRFLLLAGLGLAASCSSSPPLDAPAHFDVILRHGTVYDGDGGVPYVADVALRGDRVAAIGDLSEASADEEIDVTGMAVAPGFINMLSWATQSLLVDPRGLSDIRQGVTLEVFGEGWSMGPLNETMRDEMLATQAHLRFDVPWTTLGEYLEHLERRGVAPNVASFVGATTVRIHELGHEDRPPDARELERMKALVRQAMEEGALGVGSSLIYAPAFYASTEELIELCRVAAAYGGRYITHIRSEGNQLEEAIEEVITIARESGIGAEVYHLKAAGAENWPKMSAVLERIDRVRAEGLDVSADVYLYPAGATGLNAAMPPWVQEGGREAWIARLQDPDVRARVLEEMRTPTDEWENLLLAAGSPEQVILVGFAKEAHLPLVGKTLAEVAAMRGQSAEDTAIDLVIADETRVDTVYFLMSEENIAAKLARPWVSLGSDAGAPAPVEPFTRKNPHPRAYGNFARLFARYVRELGVLSVEEAVRRATALPADHLGLRDRGRLRPGFFADVVVFDPATIQDHATFADPHQLATGVAHVFVNGSAVLRAGRATGATPGRVVRGPGWAGR